MHKVYAPQFCSRTYMTESWGFQQKCSEWNNCLHDKFQCVNMAVKYSVFCSCIKGPPLAVPLIRRMHILSLLLLLLLIRGTHLVLGLKALTSWRWSEHFGRVGCLAATSVTQDMLQSHFSLRQLHNNTPICPLVLCFGAVWIVKVSTELNS